MASVNRKRYKVEHYTDKSDYMTKLRKSVIAVLAKNKNYSGYIGKPKVVNEIAESVFATMYKHTRNGYILKQNTFGDMVTNIISHTEKVADVHETKDKIVKAAKVLSEEEVFKTEVDVVYASLSEKLTEESSYELDAFESNFKNLVKETLYSNTDFDLSQLPARKDLLYLDLILVAEGTNKNKDTILATELEKSYQTLVGMPVVEEHQATAIRGIFYKSELVKIKPGNAPGSIRIVEKGGSTAVRAKAYIYKKRFPREAYVLKDRDSQGLLRYSVELAFTEVECSECNKTFSPAGPFCDHLLLRHDIAESGFTRIVKNIYFIGGAYTTQPAESRAISIEVVDPEDTETNEKDSKKDEKETKSMESCVTTVDDSGKTVVENTDEEEPKESANPNKDENSSYNSNGGQRMDFSYKSLDELYASPEINALVEAKVEDVLQSEREAFEASLTETSELLESANSERSELETKLAELTVKYAEATETIAQNTTEQRTSKALLELQAGGFTFDSDEDLQAFVSKIESMTDDQATYLVDVMRQTIVAKAKTEEDESSQADEETETNSETSENSDEHIEASQDADTHAASEEGDKTFSAIGKRWAATLHKVTNGDD